MVEDIKKWNSVISKAKEQAKSNRAAWNPYVELFRDGEFKEGTGASANHTFSDVTLLMAALYAQNPSIEIETRYNQDSGWFNALVPGRYKSGDEAADAYAQLLEHVLTYAYDETQAGVQNNAALFEAIVQGMGVTKISFDPQRQLPRLDSLRRDELFVDPAARFDITQARYLVQTVTQPIAHAQQFFDTIGAGIKVEGNYRAIDDMGLLAHMAKENYPQQDEPDLFRYFEIWDKDSGQVLYRHWNKEEWIFQRDWPYLLDHDDFPYSLLIFNTQYTQVNDAFSDLHVINGLRATYERIVEFYRRHVQRSIANKVVYDKSVFGENVADLTDAHDMKFIGVQLAGRNIQDVIQKVSFTENSAAVIELANSVKSIKDQISGIDNVRRGVEGKDKTATEAQLIDEYAKNRFSRRQQIIDAWLRNQVRKCAQIAVILTPSEKVAKIAGPEGALLWSMASLDHEDVVAEYTIGVQAGSTGERAKRLQLERMSRFFDRAQTVNQTSPVPVFDTVAIAKKMLELDGIRRVERYFMLPAPVPKDAGLMPEQQAVSNPEGSQVPGPVSPAPMTPQQAAPQPAGVM